MKTITVADVVLGQIKQVPGYSIYSIRDFDLPIYVGQSKDVIARIRHGHMSSSQPTRTGQLIEINKPESLGWRIDLYTLAECEQFVFEQTFWPIVDDMHFNVDMAEKSMIQILRTVNNRQHNRTPRKLPNEYRGHSILKQKLFAYAPEIHEALWLQDMVLSGWLCIEDEECGQIEWVHESGMIVGDAFMSSFRQKGEVPSTKVIQQEFVK